MTIHIPFLLPVIFGWLHLLHSPSVLFLFQVWGLPLKGEKEQKVDAEDTLIEEENLKAMLDQEYDKVFGGMVRKTMALLQTLLRAHQKPLDQVQAEMNPKTETFVEENRHPLANWELGEVVED